ncbi:hypothetical protein OHA21_13610 [Actinoplanes sp. NBC_00393]|uniref:hypothetical protein n=1 Tax=Actinoplanes sp. NBC_00393 TaxID=2975953 RepID=UPI002E20D7F9
MFARLLRREPAAPAGPQAPPFDHHPALDDHALRDALTRVGFGDWQAARDVVAASGTDWELRGRRITLLAGEAVANDAWLYQWLRTDADDPAAVLIQAAMLNGRAGEARGSPRRIRPAPSSSRPSPPCPTPPRR